MVNSGNRIDEEKIPEIIIRMADEKTEKGKKNLTIEGLRFINPMYEALIRVFQRNIQPKTIVQRFASDEQSLRTVIATDTLLDYLDARKRPQIESLLASGRPLEEILLTISLDLSEGHRIQNGEVLTNASGDIKNFPYLISALKNYNGAIYLPTPSIADLKKKANNIKIISRIKRSLAIGIIGTALFAGVYTTHLKVNKFSAISGDITKLEKTYTNLKSEYTALEKEMEGYAGKKEEAKKKLLDLELKISYQETAFQTLATKNQTARDEYKQKQDSLSELESNAKEKTEKLNELTTSFEKLESRQQQTLEKVKKAMEDISGISLVYSKLATQYYDVGQTNAAKLMAEKAIELDSKNISAYGTLGSVARIEGARYSALRYFEKAIEMNPTNSLAYVNLGNYYLEINNGSMAVNYYEKAIKINPEDKEARYNLGVYYAQYGDKEIAKDNFRKYLRFEDNMADPRVKEVQTKLEGLN